MSLLFDQNLSRRLVTLLADVFPGARHVALIGLHRAPDREVAAYAREHGLAVVSKDADFVDLISLTEAPAKVLWLRLGNCSTGEVATTLRTERNAIEAFLADPESSVLELG